MTHVFVAYKIKRGGAELANGGLKVTMTEQSLVLENSESGEILTQLDLSNTINAETSTWTCSAKRIDIKLAKTAQDLNWLGLEQSSSGNRAQAIPAVAASGPGPSYPSSSKVKKDWSKIDRDIEKECEDDKPEGDAALNGLFKQIYERSDPDTRRAMMKSYQTSNGTVLSTNWGEVNDKDYEGKDRPSAPDGQKWADEK